MSTRVPIPWLRILAEGAVIVVSILLALGADAWWDGRQRRIDERASLELIERDLSETIPQLAEFEDIAEGSLTTALAAYAALSGPAINIDKEAVSRHIVAASARFTVRPPSPAYTDLLSTGNIRIIRSRQLRDQIIRFYEAAHRTQEILDRNNAIYIDDLQYKQLFGRGLLLRRPGMVIGTGVFDAQSDTIRARLGTGVFDAQSDTIRARLGEGFDHGEDPIWSYPPRSPEWNAVRGTLIGVARGMTASRIAAAQLRKDAATLRNAVRDYLERN